MAHQNPKGRASFLSDIKGVKQKAAGGFRTFRHERLTDRAAPTAHRPGEAFRQVLAPGAPAL